MRGPKYLASEVANIVERLRAATDRAATKEMKTLLGYARAQGISTGAVLLASLEGDIAPGAVDLTRKGLRSLYYQF